MSSSQPQSSDLKKISGTPIAFFECSKCGERLPPTSAQTICPKDGGSLWVRYDFGPVRARVKPAQIAARPRNLWRYRELLPDADPVSLGEGFTPMLRSSRRPNVWVKDEGANPTGSFKARGLCMAVTMARHYGLTKLGIPSAGNAAGALAAYAAAAGMEAHIFMPKDVPEANLVECTAYGADVQLVDGLIGDCARMLGERKQAEGWFDVSSLKEPFRVEGKKTMGLEEAEDDRSSGGRMCTDSKSLRRGQAGIGSLERRAHLRLRSASAKSLCRLHHSRHRAPQRRHGHCCY